MEGPIESTPDGGYITAPDRSFTVWAGSLEAIGIQQFSAGKTAALAIGVPVGSAAFIALAYYVLISIGQGLSGLGGR